MARLPNAPTPRALRAGAVAALAVAAAGAAAACGDAVDRLLAVETPSRLADSAFLVPANARPITTSAQVDFECAYNSYVVASGLAAGELADGSQTAARWSYDRREVQSGEALYATGSCVGLGVYTPISTARFTNDQALTRLEGWTDAEVPNRGLLRLNAAVYAGYSYVLLAEGFCSAAVNVGPELTTANLLDSAEARFSRAVELAGGVTGARRDTLLNAAYVGRARARLGRGNRAGAAEDAARVPVAFVLNATAGNAPDRRVNRAFQQNYAARSVTVAPAYRGLTVQGAPDPRVRVVDSLRNTPNGLRLWVQTKYPGLASPIPLASGVEAQLILAEAQGGAAGVATLNALRGRPGVGLPALTAAEAADFTATLFEERRRQLFLQGTRWFDLRRANLPLVPAPGAAYANGGSYGTQRCWPLPDVERAANPNAPATPGGTAGG
jgi:hypothetical protein